MISAGISLKEANSISTLSDKAFISEFFGPVDFIEKKPLFTSGFSGSAHERISAHLKNGNLISLVLKLVKPYQDMTVWRSGNIPAREALFIGNREMSEVWNIFQCPYLAYAIEGDHSGLLMYDLSEYLFPDVRAPISREDENKILKTLAKMHAHFWQHKSLSQPWLTRSEFFFNFLGPHSVKEERNAGRDHPIFESVESGWDTAFKFLPKKIISFVLNLPYQKVSLSLPQTLIHGDAKVANFATLPGEKIAAFDWTMVASASPACELGWYVAVNASRLSCEKEKVMNRYKEFLHIAGKKIDNPAWDLMKDIAVLSGVSVLLWNKALNLQKNIPGAKQEWEWWVDNLVRCQEKYGNDLC